MTLDDMKRKVYALIEEYDENSDTYTSDEDFSNKINFVINQIQNELSRIKRLPFYQEVTATEGTNVTFATIEALINANIYQIKQIRGEYELKADGTIIVPTEDGTLEIEGYKYPKQITDLTNDNYTFELSQDVLEIMPYGVAGDLLKSDVSNSYGNIYSQRYENMKNQLDMRYNYGKIEYTGGVDIY